MELFSNLAWAAVSIAMLAIWVAIRRRMHRPALLPGIGIQIIAFAMTTTILLPAISVTDDLHSCAIPAEVERTCSWNHRNLASAQAPHSVPIALALLASLPQLMGLRTIARIATNDAISCRLGECGRQLWSRPPPAA